MRYQNMSGKYSRNHYTAICISSVGHSLSQSSCTVVLKLVLMVTLFVSLNGNLLKMPHYNGLVMNTSNGISLLHQQEASVYSQSALKCNHSKSRWTWLILETAWCQRGHSVWFITVGRASLLPTAKCLESSSTAHTLHCQMETLTSYNNLRNTEETLWGVTRVCASTPVILELQHLRC